MTPPAGTPQPQPPAEPKKGFTWGHALTLVFVAFALFIGQFIWRAIASEGELVADKPYEQGLVYQERLNALNRGKRFENQVQLTQTADGLVLTLPADSGAVEGTVEFQRPDRTAPDQVASFTAAETNLGVQLRSGRWKVAVMWHWDSLNYRIERDLYVP